MAGRLKWGLDKEDISDDAVGFEPYTGSLPPRGVYRLRIGKMSTQMSSNDNPMLVCLWVIDHDDADSRSVYNGCPVWDNVVATKKSAFRVARFRRAIGVTELDLLNRTMIDDDDNVTKIGRIKVPGLQVLALLAIENSEEYGERVRVDQYLPHDYVDEFADEEDEDEDEYDDDEEAEYEDEEEVEDEEVDEDEEEEVEDEEDVAEDEDEEEEPEPAPARTRRASAAKKAPTKKAAAKKTTTARGRKSPF
jgi:hypothetical protein